MSNNNGRNSDVVIDFNSEVKGIMNGVNSQDGRELKLAVGIYLAPEKFNLENMLTSDKVGEKILTALSSQSQAFADKVSELTALKKEMKDASLARKTEIAFKIEAINKALGGARTMFHRALQSAYFLRNRNAVIVDLKASYVTIEVAIDDKRIRDQLTRGDLHKKGVELLKSTGAVKSRQSAGTGSKPVSVKEKLKEVNTVSDGMKVLNETVNSYVGKMKDEFVADKNTVALLATLMHKAFAHEGTIDMLDVAGFIRENVSNVAVNHSASRRQAA